MAGTRRKTKAKTFVHKDEGRLFIAKENYSFNEPKPLEGRYLRKGIYGHQ